MHANSDGWSSIWSAEYASGLFYVWSGEQAFSGELWDFLILSGCEQGKQSDQLLMEATEDLIWPASERLDSPHFEQSKRPLCTTHSVQISCARVCVRSHFHKVHEEANYCGFLLQLGICAPDCCVRFSTGSLRHCRHISDLKTDQSCHQHGELSPGMCVWVCKFMQATECSQAYPTKTPPPLISSPIWNTLIHRELSLSLSLSLSASHISLSLPTSLPLPVSLVHTHRS